jgi:helix-turn-helix protein
MDSVWKAGPQDQNSFLILLAIADHCNDEGTCYPSIATLATKSRCSQRSVMRGIVSLEQGKWIKVRRDAIGGRGNQYVVNLKKLHELKLKKDKKQVTKRQVAGSHMTERHVTNSHVTKRHVTKTTRDTCQPVNSPTPPIRKNRQLTVNTPYSPPASHGDANAPPPLLPPEGVTQHDHTAEAIERVVTELGITNRRLCRSLEEVLTQQRKQQDVTAYEISERMIAAWQQYQNLAPYRSSYPWSVRTFFTQGHWLKPESWPIDYARMERDQHARLGTRVH